jgi:multiple sugar transport system ATP-binding protein
MAQVSIENVSKTYAGTIQAVNDASFVVQDQEFMVLVGPSGCGKSTLLRMVAGLEDVTEGTIRIDDRIVNQVPPRERDIAMVFQNYALYPHMSVFDNMALGLRIRKVPREEIRSSVEGAARVLGIEPLLQRRPGELSGGQRQRVAVGRAIVREPKVFLFDEPLSNLDPDMRAEMRTEISRLHHKLGATMIYVTHDQVEAMTMGSRIVVIKDGIVQQVDTPMALYNHPANRFVASFVGTPRMNFWPVKLSTEEGGMLRIGKRRLGLRGSMPESLARLCERELILGLRAEDAPLAESAGSPRFCAEIRATVDVIEPLGSETLLYWNLEGVTATSRVPSGMEISVEQEIPLLLNLGLAHYFDPESGKTLLSQPA